MRLPRLPLWMLALSLLGHTGTAASSRQEQPRTIGTIAGHVTTVGRPMPGVAVTIKPLLPAMSYPNVTATTDDQGDYALAGVPAGAWRVIATAPGYATRGDLEYQKVTLGEGEAVKGIDFEMVAAATISGRILTAEGEPIAGATIFLHKVTPAFQIVRDRVVPAMTSNALGAYAFDAVQEGNYWVSVRPWPAGDARQAAIGCSYPAGAKPGAGPALKVMPGAALTAIDVTCGATTRAGATASGRVVDAVSRLPLPAMRLIYGVLDQRPLASEAWNDVWTDAEGHFVLRGLKPGKGWVGLFHSESGEWYSRPAIFDVGAPDASVIEVLAEHGVTLAGRVVFSGGRPLDPAKPEDRFFVGFTPRDVTQGAARVLGGSLDVRFYKGVRTERDGTFRLTGLPPGEGTVGIKRVINQFSDDYAVSIQRKGVDLRGGRLTVPGDGDLTIVMTTGGGTIRGAVRALDGALRPARLEVWGALVDSPSGALTRKAVVNPDGRFAMDHLPAGQYEVMVVQYLDTGTTRRSGDVHRVVLAKDQVVEIDLPIGQR